MPDRFVKGVHGTRRNVVVISAFLLMLVVIAMFTVILVRGETVLIAPIFAIVAATLFGIVVLGSIIRRD